MQSGLDRGDARRGTLGIGAVAIIAGFGLLVAEYVEKTDKESTEMLRTLFNFLRVGVALVVLGLLFMTSWNYLYAVLGKHVPGIAKDILWVYLGIGLVALAVLIVISLLPKDWADQLKESAGEKIPGWLAARPTSNKRSFVLYTLRWGTRSSASWGQPFSARSSPRPWDHPDTWVKVAFIATVGWVLIATLAPLFYLLVRCSPVFGDGAARPWFKPGKDPDGVPTPTRTKQDVLAEQPWGGEALP